MSSNPSQPAHIFRFVVSHRKYRTMPLALAKQIAPLSRRHAATDAGRGRRLPRTSTGLAVARWREANRADLTFSEFPRGLAFVERAAALESRVYYPEITFGWGYAT